MSQTLDLVHTMTVFASFAQFIAGQAMIVILSHSQLERVGL